MKRRIGVCSWSLRPSSARELAQRAAVTGVECVQLALDPVRTGAWDEAETVGVLSDAGLPIVSGMMATVGEDYSTLESIRETGGLRPDRHWLANLAAARANADLAARLGLRLVTFHAGFLPHDPRDPERASLIERLRAVADVFAERGVRVGLETGQETAATLLGVLRDLDRPSVGVNFDPANMILYGMGDPIEAMRALAPHILQVHIKDAVSSDRPGEWGGERPCGAGEVDWSAFFATIQSAGLWCDLVIERESGESRVEDVLLARCLVQRHLGLIG